MRFLTRSILLLALAGTARAGDASFDVDASLGVRSDDNVALIDTDSLAGEADTALELEAGVGAKFRLTKQLRAEFDYDISRTDYRELDTFDLDLHHARAGLGLQLGLSDVSVSVDRFEGILDGDDYLEMTQWSPAVSRLFGQTLFLRAALTSAETRYDSIDARNASSDAIRGDAYWLLDGMRHFLALGIETKSENANDDGFDYDSRMAVATWGYRFAKAKTSLRAQLRYEERDYAEPLESGERRVDERLRGRLSVEMPMTDFLSITALVERTDNASLYEPARLDRTVYAMEVGIAF